MILAQRAVAKMMRMPQPQYFRYEIGVRDIPTDVLTGHACGFLWRDNGLSAWQRRWTREIKADEMMSNVSEKARCMGYIRIMRQLRENAKLSQEEVAKYLGTSQTMYARYERGANELPIHHLLPLCAFYGVSADQFLGLKTTEKNSKERENN